MENTRGSTPLYEAEAARQICVDPTIRPNQLTVVAESGTWLTIGSAASPSPHVIWPTCLWDRAEWECTADRFGA